MQICWFLFCTVFELLQLEAWNFTWIYFNTWGKRRHIYSYFLAFFVLIFCIHRALLKVFRTTASACTVISYSIRGQMNLTSVMTLNLTFVHKILHRLISQKIHTNRLSISPPCPEKYRDTVPSVTYTRFMGA